MQDYELAFDAAISQNLRILFVKGYQAGGGTCRSALLATDVVKAEPSFDEENWVGFAEYLVVKQPSVGAGKGKGDCIPMFGTTMYEAYYQMGVVGGIAEYSACPFLLQTVIQYRVMAVGSVPWAIDGWTGVKVKVTKFA